MLRDVVWVDDESHQYFVFLRPLRVVGGEAAGELIQAKRVEIFVDRKLVIINPVADEADTAAQTTLAIGLPA